METGCRETPAKDVACGRVDNEEERLGRAMSC